MKDAERVEMLAWVEAQKAASKAWLADQEPERAVEEITQFLERELSVDTRREALAFRAMILQDVGRVAEAKADFLNAWSLATGADYIRFELESAIADAYVAAGDQAQADQWYLTALETAEHDSRAISAGLVLRFLKFRGRTGLSAQEQAQVSKLLMMSWEFLAMPGTPDLDQPDAVARKILQARSQPI